MKTLLSVITLSLCLTLSAQSYIQLEVISLKEGQEDEYLKIEEFYSEVKRLAVEKGLQSGWAVFKNIPNDQNKIEGLSYPDYMVFNLFDSKEQMEQEIDFNSLTIMAHKGRTKKKIIKKMISNWAEPRKETRYYTYKRISNTDWGLGEFKKGMKMFGAAVQQLDESYIDYELKFFKKYHDQQIKTKERGWWELNEIISSSDNALKEMTHIIFEAPGPMWGKIENPAADFTQKMMTENGLKTRKMWPHFEMDLQYFAFRN